MKYSQILVTTSLQETWGKDEDIIFLGEWCKKFSQRDVWRNRSNVVLTDPWSDRKRREKAAKDVDEIYEKILYRLTKDLNKLHNLDYEPQYWRILCGPWLKIFINSLFHKWECVGDLQSSYSRLISIAHQDESLPNFIPKDIRHFQELVLSDLWNHNMIHKTLVSRGFKNIKNANGNPVEVQSYLKKSNPSKSKKFIYKLIEFLSLLFQRSDSTVFYNTNLTKTILLRLSLLFFSPPIFPKDIEITQFNGPYSGWRDLDDLDSSKPISFESFLYRMIKSNIPTSYLEAFNELNNIVDNLPWPKNPKTILTAVSLVSDDIFKSYAAKAMVAGAKIKTINHGGGGKFLFNDLNELEERASNSYFTWGWFENDKNHTRGHLTKKVFRGERFKSKNYFVHILLSKHPHTYNLASVPSYEQFINDYVSDQIDFQNNLNQNIRSSALLKLGAECGDEIKERLEDAIESVRIVENDIDFNKLIKFSKVVVHSYNGTTLVESMASNKPTIIFWDPYQNELSDSAKSKFKKLKDCGIFHETSKSAADHLNLIWDNPNEWWRSSKVVNAKTEFLSVFGRPSESPVRELKIFLSN